MLVHSLFQISPEMLDRRFKSDQLWLAYPHPELSGSLSFWHLGSVLMVVVLLKDEQSPQSEVKSTFFFNFLSTLWSLQVVPLKKTAPQHDSWSAVSGFLHTWCLGSMPNNSISVSLDQRFFFSWFESPLAAFGQTHAGWHASYTKKWLLSDRSSILAWLVNCCRVGSPPRRVYSFHKGMLGNWQSDFWVLCHHLDSGSSPLIAQFRLQASCRKCSDASELFPFVNDCDHCAPLPINRSSKPHVSN